MEDGVEMRGEGTVSAVGAAACLGGVVAFGPPGKMRRIRGKFKQIVGSTLQDSSNDGMELVTNFESDKSPAEFAKFYKEDELLGGHVIMLGAGPASQAAALEALRAFPDPSNLCWGCVNNG